MSSRRRVDNRTPEEKAAEKLKYHEDHHVTVKEFKDHTHDIIKALKARDRLAKTLYKNGSNTILSWIDTDNPQISYTYGFSQLKADTDFLYRQVAELIDYHRLSKSRPGAKSSANTTPTAIGPVLQTLLFSADNGGYGAVPNGVNIPGVDAGADVLALLPLAGQGLILRSTLVEAFYLYAWLRQLDNPNDGRQLRIDALMNAVFNGTQPALFTKVPVGAPTQKRNKKREVVWVQKYERAANPNGLNTVQVIESYKGNYRTRFGTPFAEGQYMGSSDFNILSALNYYSSTARAQQILDAYAEQGQTVTLEQLQQALVREYEILRDVRRFYKAQREADPTRQAAKKAKNDASKNARKGKRKTGAVTVNLGNGQSMVEYVPPQPAQSQVVNI